VDLEIEGTAEEQFAQMKTASRELWSVVKGNGKDGLIRDMEKLERRVTKAETYAEATLFWVKAVAGILGLLIAGLGIYIASLELRGKTSVLLPEKNTSGVREPAYAKSQNQDAGTGNSGYTPSSRP
jgi:hypothetical protein